MAQASRAGTGTGPAATVVVVVLAALVVLGVAGLVLISRLRDRATDEDAAATTTTEAPAPPDRGGRPVGPTSTAPLVTHGTGSSQFLSLSGTIVATEGCDVPMFQAAPDPGDSSFLLGNLHLDGDRLVLDGTSDSYHGELHEDGVLHLQTETGSSSESSIDATLHPDGTVTGVFTDVFLGDCRLHARIESGDAPSIAELTS